MKPKEKEKSQYLVTDDETAKGIESREHVSMLCCNSTPVKQLPDYNILCNALVI